MKKNHLNKLCVILLQIIFNKKDIHQFLKNIQTTLQKSKPLLSTHRASSSSLHPTQFRTNKKLCQIILECQGFQILIS